MKEILDNHQKLSHTNTKYEKKLETTEKCIKVSQDVKQSPTLSQGNFSVN